MTFLNPSLATKVLVARRILEVVCCVCIALDSDLHPPEDSDVDLHVHVQKAAAVKSHSKQNVRGDKLYYCT